MQLTILHIDHKTAIHVDQQVTTENFIANAGLDHPHVVPTNTPYCLGYPVDMIPQNPNIPQQRKEECEHMLRQYVGSLNWLSTGRRPDLSTITNMLTQYSHSANPSHITAAK